MTDQGTLEPRHRRSPREHGKQAYRDGLKLSDNPLGEDWSDGWIYQRTHYPSPVDAAVAAADLDCMSPWEGDERAYGAYS